MKCVEDVKPKGTVEGEEEENISEEEGDDVRDQSNGNGLTHDSTTYKIRNFLFQDRAHSKQTIKENK